MRIITWALAGSLLLSTLFQGSLDAQEPTIEARLRGQTQVQFSTSSLGDEDLDPDSPVAGSMFEARRVRLGADLRTSEWISGRLEADFGGGRVALTDAFIDLAFSELARLKVGQFKRPFSLIELTSSTVIPVIERGARIRGLEPLVGVPGEEHRMLALYGYHGRDLGASLRGSSGPLGWEVGVFNGAGANRAPEDESKAVAVRVTARPAPELPLTLGLAGLRKAAPDGSGLDAASGFEADLEWGAFRRPGFRLLAEAALVDIPTLPDTRSAGAQALFGYFRPLSGSRFDGVEAAGRVSWADPNRNLPDDEGLLITPGVSLYLFGRNRLMANWDIYLPADDGVDTVHSVKAQAQIAF